MHNPVITPDYVSAAQLAKEFGVSKRTLWIWRRKNDSPPVTIIGKAVYYRRQAVSDWLRKREGTSRMEIRNSPQSFSRERNARRHNARRAAR